MLTVYNFEVYIVTVKDPGMETPLAVVGLAEPFDHVHTDTLAREISGWVLSKLSVARLS